MLRRAERLPVPTTNPLTIEATPSGDDFVLTITPELTGDGYMYVIGDISDQLEVGIDFDEFDPDGEMNFVDIDEEDMTVYAADLPDNFDELQTVITVIEYDEEQIEDTIIDSVVAWGTCQFTE